MPSAVHILVEILYCTSTGRTTHQQNLKFHLQIESLQRQFKLASSEVDSLQAVESDLVNERNCLQTENAKLIEEQKKCLARLKELEAAYKKSELLKSTINQEKLNLEVSFLL